MALVLTCAVICSGYGQHSRRCEEPLQDCVGVITEGDPTDGSRQRPVHLPESVTQHTHSRTQLRKTHINALLRLETGKKKFYKALLMR